MKRLVLLLTLFLIWPLAVCAQMVSPGGGTNIYGNVAIVGGTCQSPMSMNGIDQVGNISCQAPQVSTGATAPTNPVTGQQWYDTTNNTLNIWNGTAWVPVSGTGGAFTPPDGSTWTAAGLTGLASLGVNGNTTLGGTLNVTGVTTLGSANITTANLTNAIVSGVLMIPTGGSLVFNGVPMGGTCANGEFVNALSATGIPTCAPWVGGGPAIGPTPPPNPNAGDLWVNTSAPVPTLEIWDGVAWVVVSNPSAANTSPTPPPNPIVGQIWYDSTTTPSIMKIWDGSAWVVAGGEWAPLTNPAGGINNYAPINNPAFTGTLTLNGQPVSGGTIVSATPPTTPVAGQLWFDTTDLQTYVYYNDGTSSQWVPVVNIGGSAGALPPSGSTIDSPIFTGTSTFNGPAIFNNTTNFVGTMTFPDGSYYDTNGHEVMKNLGVGVVAQSDGANAGTGPVYGNSITVDGGWNPNSGPNVNAYWDSDGINQMSTINAQWIDAIAAIDASSQAYPNTVEILEMTNPTNATFNYPWADYAIQNYGAPPTPDSGNTQLWQAEGLEFINAIGIHGDTWGNSVSDCTGTLISGADLSDCAVAAVASSIYNNVNYKMVVENFGTGNAAEASYMLHNNVPHTGGMYLTGSGFTPAAGALPDQLDINTNAANGLALTVNGTSIAQVTNAGMNVNGALTVNGGPIGAVVQTWTPTFTGFAGSGPTVTYTSQRGVYTVQGNMVTFSFWVQWSSFVMGTGLVVLPLPASQTGVPNAFTAVSCGQWENINLGPGPQTYLGAFIDPGDAWLSFGPSGDNQQGSGEPQFNNGVGYVGCQGWFSTGP